MTKIWIKYIRDQFFHTYPTIPFSICLINNYFRFPEISRNIPFAQSTGNSSLRQQCPKRGIPHCTPASLRYRTADGSCNNVQNPWWGSAMSTMQRSEQIKYKYDNPAKNVVNFLAQTL